MSWAIVCAQVCSEVILQLTTILRGSSESSLPNMKKLLILIQTKEVLNIDAAHLSSVSAMGKEVHEGEKTKQRSLARPPCQHFPWSNSSLNETNHPFPPKLLQAILGKHFHKISKPHAGWQHTISRFQVRDFHLTPECSRPIGTSASHKSWRTDGTEMLILIESKLSVRNEFSFLLSRFL